MLLRPLLALVLLVVAALAAPGGELDQAVAVFRQSLVTGGEARSDALARLAGLGDPGATPVIADEHARCSAALRGASDVAGELQNALEHRRAVVTDLERRAPDDESFAAVLEEHRRAIESMEKDLRRAEQTIARESPWRDELAAATAQLFEALGDGKRKAAEKLLWQDVRDLPDLQARLGAIEMLGRVGGVGTALALRDELGALLAETTEIHRKLPKAEADVHKLEKRIQREIEQLGGRGVPQSSQNEYERARAGAADMRRRLAALEQLVEAGLDAAAAALAREPEDARLRSVQAMDRALDRDEGKARLAGFAILARARTPVAADLVHARLEREKDPAAIARILAESARAGDAAIVLPIVARWLDHETWLVRAAALDALVTLRSKDAIGPLIERLGSSEGRARTDVRHALMGLTGKDFRGNTALWSKWWEANAATFEVPAEPPRSVARDAHAVEGTYVVTFFGIETESRRVLFVLDVSGSMNFSMVARANPTDEPGAPPDMPREGELSRLAAAKRDLLQALDGLEDGSTCNLILYASDVWSWQDAPIVLDPEKRAELRAYVEGLEAIGGTNVFGALELAFEMCGVGDSGRWEQPAFDTIFLLSDGRPSIGVTQSTDEILAFVREKNRAAGIVLHTIGLSGAHNAHLLRELAEQNGGTYAAH